VTHDPGEALRIADRIALLERGRLVQVGTPEALYCAPRTVAAARFFSDIATVPGTTDGSRLATAIGSFPAPGLPAGTPALACIRPEHLTLAAEPTAVPGRVLAAEYCGDQRRLVVELKGATGTLPVAAPVIGPAPAAGAAVHLKIHAEGVPVVANG
jgi:iron(III) transport system ATP-binding protein